MIYHIFNSRSYDLCNMTHAHCKTLGEVRAIDNKKQLRYQTDMMIKSSFFNGQLEGFVDRSKGDKKVFTTRLEVSYNANDKFVLNHKWRDLSSGNRLQFSANR